MEQIYNNLGEVCPGVRMLDESQVALLFSLRKRGWSLKAISKEWGWSRNTIQGWLDRVLPTDRPEMGRPRKLAKEETYLRSEFNGGVRNADVLRQQLAAKGVEVGLRMVERAVEIWRQEHRAAEAPTLRFETDPGEQLQINFGEKWIVVGGARVKAFVFVATLGYSRRTFAQIYPAMRQQHWLEGLEAAMHHFGGATKECLVDNAKALVIHWKDDEPHYHPEFKAFCAHWGMRPRACRPYRPRTKGKVESGVKYVKGNALGRLAYTSWDALHAHLDWWMIEQGATCLFVPAMGLVAQLTRSEMEGRLEERLAHLSGIDFRDQREGLGVADSAEQSEPGISLRWNCRWPDFGEQTYADSGER